MEGTIFEADEKFGLYLKNYHPEVLAGYYVWVFSVVRLMKKSSFFTKIVNLFAKPWAYYMAYRMGARERGNFVGAILMFIGGPICWVIGQFRSDNSDILKAVD